MPKGGKFQAESLNSERILKKKTTKNPRGQKEIRAEEKTG